MADGPISRIRAVLSGENSSGRAVFASVREVPPLLHGSKFYGVWGWDKTPQLPFMPSDEYEATSIHPPEGGVRVNIVEFAPGLTVPRVDSRELTPEQQAAREKFNELLYTEFSNYTDSEDVAETGLHRTDSIDICFVIDGKMVMALDDGAKQVLERGDCFVQYGTMHQYQNPFDEPCLMGIVVLPATRRQSAS